MWLNCFTFAEGPANTEAAEAMKQTYKPSFTIFEEEIGFQYGSTPVHYSAPEELPSQTTDKTEDKPSLWKKLTGRK